MRVLHVAETIKGGVATVLNELTKHQRANLSDKIDILIPEEQKEEVISNDDNYFFIRKKRSISALLNLLKIYKVLIKKNKYDIIHIHSTFAGVVCRLYNILTLNRTKIIYCPHAFSFLMVTSNFKRKAYIAIESILAYKTKYIICVSEYERKMALSVGLPESKLIRIYNGIEYESRDKAKLTGRGTQKFLFVGRFDYQKGFDLLINACKKISNINNDIKFTIIGSFVTEIGKEINISDINNITIKTWMKKEELSQEYLENDILIMPSRWEGFAMVPIEAFKFGMPVIASNNTAFPEIIDEGINGLLFENQSLESLIDKILKIKDLDIDYLSISARKKYEENYISTLMNEEVLKLYYD